MLSTLKKKIEYSHGLSNLGKTSGDKAKLFLLVFWPFLEKRFKKIGVEYKPDFTITIQYKNREQKIYFQGHHDEITLLYEIFVEECYRTEEIQNPEVIIDAGANIGLSSLYFAMSYPSATVYAIEPDPPNFKLLVANTEGKSNIQPRQIAFSDNNTEKDLYLYPDKLISSSLRPRLENQERVSVVCRTLESFLFEEKLNRVDILKFDVEGAEFDMLKGTKVLGGVTALIGEVHEDLMGKPMKEFYRLIPQSFTFYRKEKQKDHREFFYALQDKTL